MDTVSEGYNQERMKILQMVEDGKISASEAATLLSSISAKGKSPAPEATPPNFWGEASSTTSLPEGQPAEAEKKLQSPNGPRWFRVRVTSLANGRAKTTVNLPIGLVNWGLKIGARYAPEVDSIDLSELSEMLQSGAEGKLVDVIDEEDGEHVEIFVD